MAWEQANGPISVGLFVCHRCDNPSCINIEHLFLGTARRNSADMVNKGRGRNQFTDATHCVNGHEFNEANTYYYKDGRGRQCKECWRIRAYLRKR